jgi:3-oxoacyl-[acyl-carrier-protein] synthase-3
MTQIKAAITGICGYVPDYILTNAELETMVDTSDEWITSRTGIKERRILKGEGMGTSHMGAEAIRGLLRKTDTRPEDIDLIICSTTTPDFVFPAAANIISDMVGAKNAFSYDMQAACSGFLYAMSTAAQFIETGRYKKVIVVGADKMSSIVDYQDRSTCIIFGDGAGAPSWNRIPKATASSTLCSSRTGRASTTWCRRPGAAAARPPSRR